MRETIVEGGTTFRLPCGMLGAGVGLTFLLGRSFSFTDEEPPTAGNAAMILPWLRGSPALCVEWSR